VEKRAKKGCGRVGGKGDARRERKKVDND